MELLNRKTAKQYYSDPLLENLLKAVFTKYKGQNGVKGNARIIVRSKAEAEKLQNYFGNRVTQLIFPGSEVEVHLAIFSEELERGYGLTIPELYEVLYNSQLLTNREQKELKLSAWIQLFEKVERDFINEFSITTTELEKFSQKTFNWFGRLKNGEGEGYRVLKNISNKGEDAYSDLFVCMSALWHLLMRKNEMLEKQGISTGKIRLPTFAAYVTEDPHAFDKKRAGGRLLWHALHDIDNHKSVFDKIQKNEKTVVPEYLFERQIYRNFDVLDDDLSSISHIFVPNLVRGTSPRTINLREVEEIQQLPKYSALYIIENPSIISYLADETIHFLNKNDLSLEQLPINFPVLLCTIGQARTASKLFIEKCLASNPNCAIYYSGDIDVPGIQMLYGMKEQFTAQFNAWRMDSFIYRKYVAPKSKTLSEEDLKLLRKDEGVLEREMVQIGAKVYQESFGKELGKDWIEVICGAI
ncbi:TIGR02679 domain-containing protein [Paenibacillus sp. NPDC055715]